MTGASALSLPTPLARLYGVAMQAGTHVQDAPDGAALPPELAATCWGGHTIAFDPQISDDHVRACVLATGLAVLAVMRSEPEPGAIWAPDGVVAIWHEEAAPETEAPFIGRLAVAIAERVGVPAPRAHAWSVPVLAEDTGSAS